jgi:hypothetical protein
MTSGISVFVKFRSADDFLEFPELFYYRKIRGIGLQPHGPGPWSRLTGSWYENSSRNIQPEIYNPDFMYRKCIYPSNLGRTGKIGRRCDSHQPGAARARAHGGAPWPSVAARRSSGFLEPWWSVSDEVCPYRITATTGTRLG